MGQQPEPEIQDGEATTYAAVQNTPRSTGQPATEATEQQSGNEAEQSALETTAQLPEQTEEKWSKQQPMSFVSSQCLRLRNQRNRSLKLPAKSTQMHSCIFNCLSETGHIVEY